MEIGLTYKDSESLIWWRACVVSRFRTDTIRACNIGDVPINPELRGFVDFPGPVHLQIYSKSRIQSTPPQRVWPSIYDGLKVARNIREVFAKYRSVRTEKGPDQNTTGARLK